MTKSTIWVVLGDNGSGNSGNVVLGMYPTEALALTRIQKLKNSDDCPEYVYYDSVETDENGTDCEISVGG